jgi:SAM-dependent methyltransferase
MICNVCQTELDKPLYESPSDQSLTSLCELRQGKVKVWLCWSCGHLSSEALLDTKDFYESEYRIMLNQDDEDQIYEVRDKHIVYRTAHQLDTLFAKLDLPKGSRILDYGCAKALMLSRLMSIRSDLQVYLFDVSSMYISYWQKFLSADRWAIHETPENWLGSFDVVTSFFTLEHIPDPINTVRKVATLLNKDGVFYGIVPDTFGNVADFIVIDHVNHFTEHSLYFLLKSAGFNNIKIDANAHRGALVFIARKGNHFSVSPSLENNLQASKQLADYWSRLGNSLRILESEHAGLPSAIYGSGFYGSYILSVLKKPENVNFFLDANPFQQSKILFRRVILEPSKLPEDIRLLYIGLNPNIARASVAKMDWLHNRNIKLIFLD